MDLTAPDDVMTTIAGVLLTGGRSRRIGTDKASLLLDGETLATRSARCLVQLCDPVLEVGDGLSGLSSLREHPPGLGPLAALAAAGLNWCAHVMGRTRCSRPTAWSPPVSARCTSCSTWSNTSSSTRACGSRSA